MTDMIADHDSKTCEQRMEYSAGPTSRRHPPLTRPCGEPAVTIMDGVVLCARHALLKLEIEAEATEELT